MSISIEKRPILKWAGGKQAIADRLAATFPSHGVYYEPFVGGASVFLAVSPVKAVIGDLNDWLTNTYIAIRDDWSKVARLLDRMENSKQEYLRIRAVQPDSLDRFQRAAHLIYLNKTCFRGLFRVNRKNQFNVPYGAYDRRYYSPENFEAFAAALHNVEIRSRDFELCIADATSQDFIYFDPPYYKLGGYSDFNRYTRFQFRENDHIRLAAVCRELDQRGIHWLSAIATTEFVRRLFRGYRTVSMANRREINLRSQDRDVSELLITNY